MLITPSIKEHQLDTNQLTHQLGMNQVFDHFIDKYSSFGYINRKSDAFDKFIEFKVELDNLLGKHIKTLRLD